MMPAKFQIYTSNTQATHTHKNIYYLLNYLWTRLQRIYGHVHIIANFSAISNSNWTSYRPIQEVIAQVIGPLHDPVTWYKITHAGAQVAQWDFQTKGRSRWTGTSYIVLEVSLCNLHTSMCDFVPCDRITQRAYFKIGRESSERPNLNYEHDYSLNCTIRGPITN